MSDHRQILLALTKKKVVILMFACVLAARNSGLTDLYVLTSALACAPMDTEYPKHIRINSEDIPESIGLSIEEFNLWITGIRINLKLREQDLAPELLARSNSDEILVKEDFLLQAIKILERFGLYGM